MDSRIKQHQAAYRRMDQNNAMFVHAWENDHRIDWNGANIIEKCSHPRKRRILEATKILYSDTFNLRQESIDLEIETFNLINEIYKLDGTNTITPDPP